jgi:hypothetical protein
MSLATSGVIPIPIIAYLHTAATVRDSAPPWSILSTLVEGSLTRVMGIYQQLQKRLGGSLEIKPKHEGSGWVEAQVKS